MAASRKLQGEIDRCLKKVAEGVEQFEDIWKKVHNATNSNQKEKYEADLKKEIKKLQRLRDQIKSWLQSGEIKDKTQLLENRKLIETQMERFKVVERETKTKAYSKEGLGAAQNKDPAQKERDETNRWLSECIDTLNIQLDQYESEIESLMAAGKKKKIDREKLDRVDGLRHSLERHRFHIGKLEILMRMLNNESITCDEIKRIREDIEYYIESSQDPDFMENEGLYDDIVMEDLDYPAPEISVGKTVPGSLDSTEGSTPSSSVCGSSPAPSPAATVNHSNDHNAAESTSLNNQTNSASHHERKRSTKSEESRSGSTPVKPQVVRPSSNSSIPSVVNALSNHSSSGNKSSLSSTTPTKPVSGTTSQSTPNNSSTSSGLSNHIISIQTNNREVSQGNATSIHNSINSLSSLSSISNSSPHSISNGPVYLVSSSGNSIITSTHTSNASGVVPVLNSTSSVTSNSTSVSQIIGSGTKSESGVSLKEMAQKKLNEVSSSSTTLNSESLSSSVANSVSNGSTSSTVASVLTNSQNARDKPPVPTTEAHIPPLLGVAPLGPIHLTPEHKLQYERLQGSFYHMPHPSDSERFRLHFPRQPLTTPTYYPQVREKSLSGDFQNQLPMSDTVDFFQRLSTETLFFIFYYMEGTKAQYLAAKALKKQSWRFHTNYMMWFQRHEEPKAITDEFEQGTYIYFDFENWGQRKKENFIFEYRFLEDRDLN